MKEFKFVIDGHKFTTTVNELGGDLAEVTVNGTAFKVQIEKDQPAAAPKPAPVAPKAEAPKPAAQPAEAPKPAAAPADGVKVTSPLPGSVIKVTVSEGQAVKKGDTLLILESMKMENPVLAEQDGTVKQIAVSAGQNVMQDDLLIVLG